MILSRLIDKGTADNVMHILQIQALRVVTLWKEIQRKGHAHYIKLLEIVLFFNILEIFIAPCTSHQYY